MVRTGMAAGGYGGWAAVVILATATGAGAQTGPRAGAEARPAFQADVVIDEQVVDEHGVVVETRPTTKYRMTIRRGTRGLRTEIEYPEARLFPKGPLVDPRSGSRLVVEGDLASGRIYDAAGVQVFGPPPAETSGGDAGTPATTGLVQADRDAASRRRELLQRFGRARERIGGRDRYLVSEGDVQTEALVEPATHLPVEVNVLRGGALEQRTTLAYGRMPGGRWYVARMRSEMALPGDESRRFVSTRTHTNVDAQEGR